MTEVVEPEEEEGNLLPLIVRIAWDKCIVWCLFSPLGFERLKYWKEPDVIGVWQEQGLYMITSDPRCGCWPRVTHLHRSVHLLLFQGCDNFQKAGPTLHRTVIEVCVMTHLFLLISVSSHYSSPRLYLHLFTLSLCN